ncbi:MAG: protein translocase subunit SecF [Gemmatimonadota bacterium]
MRIFADADYPFLEWRRRAYVVSALLLLAGIGGMIFNVASLGAWLNYGVDFSGGTMVQVRFEEQVTIDQVRAVDPGGWQITRFGEPEESEFIIRMQTFEESLGADPAEQVISSLSEQFGPETFQVVRTEAVGPTVGNELQTRALYAILISFVLTLIYLAFRFEWRFGVAAVIATAHDILITLGFIALLRMEISVATVAAFLTIVGYSLNDTIVVFDRVRENLANRKRGVEYADIIDRSINETLPRTVLTSGTTLATLGSLYLFGGAVIRDFALVLIMGIAIGTFSSIFVASPALAAIERKWPRAATRPRAGSGAKRKREPASV